MVDKFVMPMPNDDDDSNEIPKHPLQKMPQADSTVDNNWVKHADKETTLGVWGAPGSGKSVFFASAIHALTVRLGANPNSLNRQSYEIDARKMGREAEESANRFLKDIVAAYASGKMPSATIDLRPFALELLYRDWSKKGIYHHKMILDLLDSAGEMSRIDDANHNYWQHLRTTRGIIFVVDGEQNANGQYKRLLQYGNNLTTGYPDLIQNFLNMMRDAPRLPYLAIVVTKCDTHRGVTSWKDLALKYQTSSQKEELVRSIVGDYFSLLQTRFQGRYQIFTSSSIGWYQDDNGDWQRNISTDGKTRPVYGQGQSEGYTSYHAAYALTWLMDQIEDEYYREKYFWLRYRLRKENHVTNIKILEEAYKQDKAYLP